MVQSHRYCVAFSALIREQWDDLKRLTFQQKFGRNALIYHVGDPPEAIYWVRSGRVKVAQLSEDGKENIIGLYQEGDWFGEVCLCNGKSRDNQAVALGAVIVVAFSVTGLLDLLRKKPELALDLLMVFCARLAESQEQVASLAFHEVRERLARELLRLSQLESGRAKTHMPMPIELTHQELANFVNTTRENITTIMNEFRRQGLIEYKRSKIHVLPTLRDYLQRKPA
jgi:CRP/FNR family transcriptional regulator